MRADQQNNMLWCSGEAVAEVFHIYYRELYNKATILKEGPIIYWDQIMEIASVLKKQHPTKGQLADALLQRIAKSSGLEVPTEQKKTTSKKK